MEIQVTIRDGSRLLCVVDCAGVTHSGSHSDVKAMIWFV